MTPDQLRGWLAAAPVRVLDGATGSELIRRGVAAAARLSAHRFVHRHFTAYLAATLAAAHISGTRAAAGADAKLAGERG